MADTHYDVAVIGAGMSGLAAGIRLAYFDRRVCIIERHNVYGGLNSFYTLDGRQFDVGLHALTNYVGPEKRQAPLNKLLRQLRISREVLDLCPQRESIIQFPDCRLRFGNDFELLVSEVQRVFGAQVDHFLRLVETIKSFNELDLSSPPRSTRKVLADYLSEPLLIEILLCPLMYYGCSQEHDMDWVQFVVMFKSIFLEGLARPRAGVRRVIAELVKKYRLCGGEFHMGSAVRRLDSSQGRVTSLALDNGATLTADTVISCAGYHETMALCRDIDGAAPATNEQDVGRLSFVESISILDTLPADLGIPHTIIFFNDAREFTYARPEGLIDVRSGVICCPNNYEGHEHLSEGIVRLTSLANYDRWVALPEPEYVASKDRCYTMITDTVTRYIPEFRDHVTYRDMFTPRTIKHYTGHLNGAVYGAASKRREGRTHLDNLFICGTDQGFLGIIGALLSGITIANLHVLSET